MKSGNDCQYGMEVDRYGPKASISRLAWNTAHWYVRMGGKSEKRHYSMDIE